MILIMDFLSCSGSCRHFMMSPEQEHSSMQMDRVRVVV